MKRKAFTLIELLVVIAIIAILAAILFPVFARAKNAARVTQTISNVKNLSTGFQMYLGDFDDTWPLWSNGMSLPHPGMWEVRHMYMGLVNPYIRNGVDLVTGNLGGVWRSPNSGPMLAPWSNTFAYNHWTLGGFSTCARVFPLPLPAICTNRTVAAYAEFASTAYNTPAPHGTLAFPAETIVIHDGAQLSRPPQYAIAFPTGDAQFIGVWGPHDMRRGPLSGPAGPSTRTGAIARLQAGARTVVGFADGHVRSVPSNTLHHQAYFTPEWRGALTNNRGWSRDWSVTP